MATPKWFDESTYFANKAEQLKAVSPAEYGSWNGSTVRDYFLKNGIDAYAHFNESGNAENVSPNSMFNALQYLQYKADQLNEIQYDGRDNWTVAEVQQAFDAAGLTAWDHYVTAGNTEGVNPSDKFDVAAYYDAKADQLNKVKYDDRENWTADDVKAAFAEAGITALEHYYASGKTEGVKVTKADAPEADGSYNVYLKATEVKGAGDFAGTANADQVLASGLTSLDFDGQAGNDTLFVSGSGNNFGTGTVDGGEGEDAIVVQDKGTSLDMSKADVLNFEKLDLGAAGKQTVTMTADQFAAFGNGTAITVSGVEDMVILNAAPEEEGMVDATAFQGSLKVTDLDGLDVKVTISQLASLEASPTNGKIAVDMATNSALNNVSSTNLDKVSDIILTGSQMDISKVTTTDSKDLHFADNAIQDITMTWAQFGKLAEFSDDSNDFALTEEDVLNVKITASDVAGMGSAPVNEKGSLVDSLIVDNSVIDLTAATWLADESEFSGFVDLGSAKANVTVGVDQYGLLQNASSTDKVYVKTTDGGKIALGDSTDTVDLSYLSPGTDSLTVEGFQTGKKGDVLNMYLDGYTATEFNTLDDLAKTGTTYELNADTMLLLNERDYNGTDSFHITSGTAWVLLQKETGLEVYKFEHTAASGPLDNSVVEQALSLDVTLVGVDITDFAPSNLTIAS